MIIGKTRTVQPLQGNRFQNFGMDFGGQDSWAFSAQEGPQLGKPAQPWN